MAASFASSRLSPPPPLITAIGANCDESLTSTVLVDWYPEPNTAHVLAVGQLNGTVTVTGISNDRVDEPAYLGIRRDLAPRALRPCTGLAWNPLQSHLLAAGLAKANKDPALMIWDVTARAVTLSDTRRRATSMVGVGGASGMGTGGMSGGEFASWRPKPAPQASVQALS